MSDAVMLAMAAGLMQAGVSDEAVASALAKCSGEPMVSFREVGGDLWDVKVNRVYSVGPHWKRGTVLTFSGVDRSHPKYQLHVDKDIHKVVRDLSDAGWLPPASEKVK